MNNTVGDVRGEFFFFISTTRGTEISPAGSLVLILGNCACQPVGLGLGLGFGLGDILLVTPQPQPLARARQVILCRCRNTVAFESSW
jgi:hypothetical protein